MIQLPSFITQRFSLDLRSIAVWRVGCGSILCLDALGRLNHIHAHYTDWGLLPRNILLEKFSNPYFWSLFLAGGQVWLPSILLMTLFICGLLLIVGFKTRLASIVSWILIISVHVRNPMVLNGGDVLLRVLLFWSMFLPLSQVMSIDSAMAKLYFKDKKASQPPPVQYSICSGSSLGFIMQLGMMYLFTALLKTSPSWWPNGDAIYLALSIDQFTTPLGDWAAQFETLNQHLTRAVYIAELSALACFLAGGWVRFASLGLLIGMHAGILLTMEVGFFPYICMVALCGLIPSCVWESRYLNKSDHNRHKQSVLKIYYDKPCSFCLKMVYILREFLQFGRGDILAIQDHHKIQALFEDEKPNSWVIELDKKYQFAGPAVYKMLTLSWFGKALPLQTTKKPLMAILDKIYLFVAQNRSTFSSLTRFIRPHSPPKKRFPIKICWILSIFVSGYTFLHNASSVQGWGVNKIALLERAGFLLRLDQKWNMFAPSPLKDDGWYVIEGKLRDESVVDVWRGIDKPPSHQKPKDVSKYYPNSRWRKYMMNLWAKKNQKHRLYFGKYLCRKWNSSIQSYSKQLLTFTIFFHAEYTPSKPQATPRYKSFKIWQHRCF